jgi:hypothetical protein
MKLIASSEKCSAVQRAAAAFRVISLRFLAVIPAARAFGLRGRRHWQLQLAVDRERLGNLNFSSAIRLFVLRHYRPPGVAGSGV